MHYLSADFIGWFQLEDLSRKAFDIVVYKKSVFFKFIFAGLGGGGRIAARQPPFWVRAWHRQISL